MTPNAYVRFPRSLLDKTPSPQSVRNIHDSLTRESSRERRNIACTFAVGILMNALVGVGWCFAFLDDREWSPSLLGVVIIPGLSCMVMFLIAIATKPDGRAELADQILGEGFRSHGNQCDPASSVVIAILLLIALYGSYCVVEAWKRMIMRIRLHGVDRAEVARVFAKICACPAGISLAVLLRPGDSPIALRRILAVLVMDAWIELDNHGTHVNLRSPTMRTLLHKHLLAEVFNVL